MARLNLRRAAIAAGLMAACSPALADPISLLVGLSGIIGTTAAAFVISYGVTIATIGFGLISSNQAKRKQAAAAAAQRSSYNASLQDRNVTGLSSEAPWQVVYGQPAPVGGSLVALLGGPPPPIDYTGLPPALVNFVNSFPRAETKHLVVVFASHECQNIFEVFLDGEPIGTNALTPNGDCTTGVFTSTYLETVTEQLFTPITGLVTPSMTPVTAQLAVFSAIGDPLYVPSQESSLTLADYEISSAVTIVGGNLQMAIPPRGPRLIAFTYQVTRTVGHVNVQKHLGGGSDVADPYLRAATTAWTASDKLTGYCYAVITLNQGLDRFKGGPPNISARIVGKKVYDFRTGQTVYSRNPALCLADFIQSEPGYGATAQQFDVPSIIAAANACDAQGFLCDGAFSTDQDRESTKQQLEDSFGGTCHQSGGVWRITPGAWTAPVMALSDADCAAPIQITQASYTSKERFNTVRGKYVSFDSLGVSTDFTPLVNASHLAADGLVKVRDMTLPFTSEHQRAQDLARMAMERSRGGLTITYPGHMRLWPLQPGDRVAINNAEFGWAGKTFRVTDWGFHPRSPVALTMVEDVPAYYNAAAIITADAAPNTNLPNPFVTQDLLGLKTLSGTDQLLVQADGTVITRVLWSWTAAVDTYILTGGKVERQWKLARDTGFVWNALADELGSETSAYQDNVPDGINIICRARFVNQRGISGAWSVLPHFVVGKTEPPPDVTEFLIKSRQLSWMPVFALDLAGYQIRFNYGQNTAWGTAQPLHTGLINASPWMPQLLPPDQVTLMIKAQDTTGNQSSNAAVIVANLGDVIVDNLILTYDDKAAGFPGTKTNSVVSAGSLLANDSGGLFWGADNSDFWGADAAQFWPTASYLGLEYATAYNVQAAEASSRLTLGATVLGESYLLQYRFDTSGPAWGADADFYWGADAGLFWTAPTSFQTWPGEILNIPVGRIEFRVVTQAGTTRGQISALTLLFDVPDEFEELNDVLVSALGTNLPITKLYRSINNVSLTLQASGTAVTVKTLNKQATGPRVACFNSAGVQVAGLIDARIQGVKG